MPLKLPLFPFLDDDPEDRFALRTRRSDLWDFPDLSTEALCAHARLIGQAGERLVDSLLLRHGVLALEGPDLLPCDRILPWPGRLLRLQVKTSVAPRADGAYRFNVSKGYQRGPVGVRPYAAEDFDLLALVGLAHDVVKFTTDRRPAQTISAGEIAGLRRGPRASLEAALEALGLDPAPGEVPPGALPDAA